MKLKNHGPLKSHPGFVLAFVERPPSWRPQSPSEVPPTAKIVERRNAPNFDSAYADMIRSNRSALKTGDKLWALVLKANSN